MYLIYGISLRRMTLSTWIYTKGSDEWYYKFIDYKTYERVCPSIEDYMYNKPPQFSICTLGQMQHIMEEG